MSEQTYQRCNNRRRHQAVNPVQEPAVAGNDGARVLDAETALYPRFRQVAALRPRLVVVADPKGYEDLKDALSYLQRLPALDPNDAQGFYYFGLALTENRDEKEAIGVFDQLLRLSFAPLADTIMPSIVGFTMENQINLALKSICSLNQLTLQLIAWRTKNCLENSYHCKYINILDRQLMRLLLLHRRNLMLATNPRHTRASEWIAFGADETIGIQLLGDFSIGKLLSQLSHLVD